MKIFIYIIRHKSKIFVALCSLAIFGIITKCASVQMKKCSFDVSVKWIANLCKQYSKNEILGNMCPLLCQRFQLIKCFGKRTGKHASLVEYKGCIEQGRVSRIVMKRGNVYLSKRLTQKLTALRNTTKSIGLVRKMVLSEAKQLFGDVLSNDTDIIRYILGDDVHQFIKSEKSDRVISSALKQTLTLGLVTEFLSLKVLGPQKLLPKLYGVCGDSYFVEYTPSLLNENYIFDGVKDIRNSRLHFPSWKERVKIAIQFLDFVQKVENIYKYPMHVCDIKGDNFGINTHRDLILLDSDSIRSNTVIWPLKCKVDKQCHYINCLGHCNQTTHRCSPFMIRNNLQRVCELIFISNWKHLGLLRHAPSTISLELSELLHECTNPRESFLKLPDENRSDKKVSFALKSLLQKSLTLV